MQFTQTQALDAYHALHHKQNALLTAVGALCGSIPAGFLFYWFSSLGGAFIILLVVPSLLIGLFARFIGHPYELAPRIPVASFAAVLHCIGVIAFGLQPMVLILAPCCFLVALGTSKTGMSPLERFAVTQVELGYLSLKSAPQKTTK